MALNIEDFISTLQTADGSSFRDDTERIRARNAASALLSRLESPWDTIVKHVWSLPAYAAALKIGYDMKLFQLWRQAGGGVKTCEDLAAITGVDQELLSRILRHLAAMHGLNEHPNQAYSMTPFLQTLASPDCMEVMPFLYRITGPGFMSLPAFLSSMKHRNPSDPHHSNWQHLRQDEYNFFQWINKDPEIARMFQTVMGQYSANKPFLTALYPIDELVKRSSAKADRAILVDVGGGAGHDLERVRECFPQLPEGSLVLQDVPEVLSQTTMKPPIIAMAHNMFDPQPIKGAAAYYFHIVLHDWPDVEAIHILKRTASAMEGAYSRILLHEVVLESAYPDARTTTSDLTMMMIASAQERTDTSWLKLAEAAGLTLVKFWTGSESVKGTECIIELELATQRE